jgi:hypothetical protein
MNMDVMTQRIDRKLLSIASLQIVIGVVMHVQGEQPQTTHVHIGLLRGIVKPRVEVFVSFDVSPRVIDLFLFQVVAKV